MRNYEFQGKILTVVFHLPSLNEHENNYVHGNVQSHHERRAKNDMRKTW